MIARDAHVVGFPESAAEQARRRGAQGEALMIPLSRSWAYAHIRMSSASKFPVEGLARFFRALGDETRVRIVALLTHGELCVCHVEAALEISQPTASRQLAILKHAGVVSARRDGSWIHYRLADQLDEGRKAQLRALIRHFSARDVLKRDVERLLKTRGPGACRD